MVSKWICLSFCIPKLLLLEGSLCPGGLPVQLSACPAALFPPSSLPCPTAPCRLLHKCCPTEFRVTSVSKAAILHSNKGRLFLVSCPDTFSFLFWWKASKDPILHQSQKPGQPGGKTLNTLQDLAQENCICLGSFSRALCPLVCSFFSNTYRVRWSP